MTIGETSAGFIVAPPARCGAALQLARLRLARGSRSSAPPLAGSSGAELDGRAAAELAGGGGLGGNNALHAVAERALDVADVRDEAHEPGQLDGGGLVGAPHGAVERDVPLDEGGAERDGGPRRRQPDLVAGVADR